MAKGRKPSSRPSASRPTRPRAASRPPAESKAASYQHPTARLILRPDAGTQAQFRKKKPPVTYRYDSSLSPALDYDGQNHARDLGEFLLAAIEAAARLEAPHQFPQPREFKSADGRVVVSVAGLHDAVAQLKRLGRPFLNWAGKAERLSFDVPTLPLFVHERLSTKAILETLKGHKRDKQLTMFDLFGDPQHPIHEQVLRAYEHVNGWTNRLILGDSLVVMNSLLHYEGLGGQVQMIYLDPPYGIKFGSNFQPFVRKRDVKHGNDDDITREPEMVKAYRDTWEVGLHSYLTYLRDRLLVCRELLSTSGSIFVQIGAENVHHARELLDEVFGAENFVSTITFAKTSGSTGDYLPGTSDYLLFYAKCLDHLKFRQPYHPKTKASEVGGAYQWLELEDGSRRRMSADERGNPNLIPSGARVFRLDNLQSQSIGREKGEGAACWFPVEYDGQEWRPSPRSRWKTNEGGMARLKASRRLAATSGGLYYVRYIDDFPAMPVGDTWDDTVIAGFASQKAYVVETSTKVVQRCVLMTTDPGDLVLDPTCGSGTTAYVAEQWGRRWISIDASRVPLALARQRLLRAPFDYFQLRDESRGPASGFIYERRKNNKGEEVGGIVPHVTLESVAKDEPPRQEVMVDRAEIDRKITRVTGPFCVEATIPTPVDWDVDGAEDSGAGAAEAYGAFVDRMLEVLRRSPSLQLSGGRSVTLHNIRPPAKTLSLSAEAMVDAAAPGQSPTLEDAVQQSLEKNGHALPMSRKPVAIVFGPENAAVSEKSVFEAAREAVAKSYTHLYVIGFSAPQPHAQTLIDNCESVVGIPATYVQATPDLMMGDLLKTMRSSQIFSVCGRPEVKLRRAPADKQAEPGAPPRYVVELIGLDVFDPIEMKNHPREGDDVPCWMLDTDYNGLCFHASQVFFPRTSAWDDLKKSLGAEYDDEVWAHLAGTVSAPFEAGEHKQIAVKVIDDRGNELPVVKRLSEAES